MVVSCGCSGIDGRTRLYSLAALGYMMHVHTWKRAPTEVQEQRRGAPFGTPCPDSRIERYPCCLRPNSM